MHTRTSRSSLARAFLSATPRTGFTLVEMLVSVTLVLMMMMMFAQVFEIASGIHVKVRGMSKNDQRSRILSTLLRSDLDKLTIRNATPFRHMEDHDNTIRDRDLANRQGYLYVSENHPASDLDDVLQFTASADLRLGDFTDSTLFSGRSVNLQEDHDLPVIFDQPDWDDGHMNDASESATAEISYFLRAGALYRRVLLLRPPHSNNSSQPRIDEDLNQNRQLNPNEDWNHNRDLDQGKEAMAYFRDSRGNPINFWSDFDYSAHWNDEIGEKDANGNGVLDPDEDFNGDGIRNLGGAMFHGTSMLDNSVNIPNDRKPTNDESAMGIRAYRFGHSLHRLTYYRAREFDDNLNFIGRFTHEETSSDKFLYPTTPIDSPHDFGLTTNVELAPDGVVARFRNGPRRSEDLLMTNVHSFDVKILRASHADPGYLELYDEDFDTRHPRDSHLLASEDVNGDGYFNHGNADGQLAPGEDVNHDCILNKGNGDGYLNRGNGNGVLETEDKNRNNMLDPGEDLNNNGVLDYMEDVNMNGVLDPGEDHNEDVNFNGMLDAGEDNDEDINKNGKLDRDEDKDGDCRLDTEDTNRNGQLDPGEDINFNGRLDLGEDFEEDVNGNDHLDIYIPHRWTPNMHVARPPQWPLSQRLPSEDLNDNGRLDPGEDGNNNGQLDFFYNEDRNGNGKLDGNEDVNNNNTLDHYVVRARNRSGRNGMWFRPMFKNNNVRFGRTGYREPEWPSRLGLAHDRRSAVDWRGRAHDGNVQWQAIPDRHRAMGIQITVRFLDPQSGQFRQVTILHPITGK